MDEKDKNKTNPESLDESTEEVSENPEVVDKNDEIKQIEEEMQKMLDEMESYFGNNVSNVKIITIDKKQKRIMTFHSVIEIILSVILLFASLGYLKWVACDKLYQYFIFIGGIVLIEYVLKYVIKKYAIKLIILSFGGFLLIAPLIGFIISVIFSPGVQVLNYGLLIIVFILYIVIKKIFMSFVKGDYRKFISGMKI